MLLNNTNELRDETYDEFDMFFFHQRREKCPRSFVPWTRKLFRHVATSSDELVAQVT